jgi:hypothetical protein
MIIIFSSLYLLIYKTNNKKPVVFEMDDIANTLTVIEINDPDLTWKDLIFWCSDNGSAELPIKEYIDRSHPAFEDTDFALGNFEKKRT